MLPLYFAKLLFLAAVNLQPGVDLPWPAYVLHQGGGGITPQVAYGSSGGPVQGICVAKGGVYRVELRLGMVPLPAGAAPVAGQVLLDTAHEQAVLTHWRAAAGEWTLQAGTVTMWMPQPGCMVLRYSASGPASVNHDWRVTTLVVHRVGE